METFLLWNRCGDLLCCKKVTTGRIVCYFHTKILRGIQTFGLISVIHLFIYSFNLTYISVHLLRRTHKQHAMPKNPLASVVHSSPILSVWIILHNTARIKPQSASCLFSVHRLSSLTRIRSERSGLPVERLLSWALLMQDLLPVVFVVNSQSALQWLSGFWQLLVLLRKKRVISALSVFALRFFF